MNWFIWFKTAHIFGVIAWFAGLFYLPRLFVYHAEATDKVSQERFVIMERRLFAMMSIGAGIALTFGICMLINTPAFLSMHWLWTKLVLVVLLIVYHQYCDKLKDDFADGKNARSAKWYRGFNEVPSLLLLAILILVVVKPF